MSISMSEVKRGGSDMGRGHFTAQWRLGTHRSVEVSRGLLRESRKGKSAAEDDVPALVQCLLGSATS